METDPSSATPFEIRCENCNVSFPVKTKSCLHCGAPLGTRFSWAPAESASQPETNEPTPGRRLGSMALWIVLALAATLARLCER